jgi:nucleoside-diphosphate-sugar epimerase
MSKGIQRVLIVGCGYIGSLVAQLLNKQGIDVWSLNRTPKHLSPQIKQILGDVTDLSSLPRLNKNFDAVVYAVSPQNKTEEAYRSAYYTGLAHVMKKINHPNNSRVILPMDKESSVRVLLVSSTGVFGQNGGEWVEEETRPNPTNETSRQLLEAERLAIRLGNPGIVIRLGGIYGPGRTRMIKKFMDGECTCPETLHYTNRIHRDDCAESICHLLSLLAPKNLYIGADNDPAPLHVIYNWMAEKTGRIDPCTEMSVDFVVKRNALRTNKRCRNQRLTESGFAFTYSTFREGYEPLMEQEIASHRHA